VDAELYLTHNGQQAVLFLPQGVYLALLILLSRRYWPALILPPCRHSVAAR
jgi:two-component system sensor histidine kinase UhpB